MPAKNTHPRLFAQDVSFPSVLKKNKNKIMLLIGLRDRQLSCQPCKGSVRASSHGDVTTQSLIMHGYVNIDMTYDETRTFKCQAI